MSAFTMNSTIKNNRKLLSIRDKFKSTLGGYNSKKTEYNLPTATTKQLNTIRKRMKAERQVWWIKITIVTLVGLFGVIVGLLFLTQQYL